MTLSLFDDPGTPELQQASPASIRSATPVRVRSLGGILLGFTNPGLASHAITAAMRAHAEQVAAEALAKMQAES